MTSQTKLALDRLHADLAAVNDLLARLTEEDVMARVSLEDRREEIKDLILNAEKRLKDETASATLFFGGQPVSGMHGIECKFAASAVGTFQDLVAMILAHRAGTLSERGAVANRESSTLYITDVARGSVGFVLEEVRPQANLTDTPLSEAVTEATQLLAAFSATNEHEFHDRLDSVEQRVVVSAGKLFQLMRRNGATLRLVTDTSDHTYGIEAVARGAARAKSTTTESEDRIVIGRLGGVLPDTRRFEFRCEEELGTISGKVARALRTNDLDYYNRELLNVRATARITLTRIYRNEQLLRETYTLLELTPVAGDHA